MSPKSKRRRQSQQALDLGKEKLAQQSSQSDEHRADNEQVVTDPSNAEEDLEPEDLFPLLSLLMSVTKQWTPALTWMRVCIRIRTMHSRHSVSNGFFKIDRNNHVSLGIFLACQLNSLHAG